jgi:hypothetical protein|tara:strand:- start:2789 stop:2986 length:198 start_codon:yes stop_codon:yes gene_type:complete
MEETTMNDEDMRQFLIAFDDFMNESTLEQKNQIRWESARQYTKGFYEKQAAELEVTVDYYMQEFV